MQTTAILRQATQGGKAGAVSVVPMTIAMAMLKKTLPGEDRYPLPPDRVTQGIESKAGVSDKMSETSHGALAAVAHAGFGAAAGAVFGLIHNRLPLPLVLAGIGFGLVVYGASYLGVLPAAGVLPRASREPAHRHLLLIASHIVWGAALGKALQRS